MKKKTNDLNKLNLVQGVLFIIAFIFLVLIVSWFAGFVFFTPYSHNTPVNEFTDKEVIELIAQQVANSHTFELHKFDCTDFSKELKDKLIEAGYSAQCVFGKNPTFDYPLHTWVEVEINNQLSYQDKETIWIEATEGYIITDDDKENYVVIRKGVCL